MRENEVVIAPFSTRWLTVVTITLASGSSLIRFLVFLRPFMLRGQRLLRPSRVRFFLFCVITCKKDDIPIQMQSCTTPMPPRGLKKSPASICAPPSADRGLRRLSHGKMWDILIWRGFGPRLWGTLREDLVDVSLTIQIPPLIWAALSLSWWEEGNLKRVENCNLREHWCWPQSIWINKQSLYRQPLRCWSGMSCSSSYLLYINLSPCVRTPSLKERRRCTFRLWRSSSQSKFFPYFQKFKEIQPRCFRLYFVTRWHPTQVFPACRTVHLFPETQQGFLFPPAQGRLLADR